MLERIRLLKEETNENLTLIMNVKCGVTELQEENLKLIQNNMRFGDDIAQLKIEINSSRYDMTLVFE